MCLETELFNHSFQMKQPIIENNLHGYVLVTPAKNEAATIGETICSVIAQSVLPREWVIVSDGSTDGTDAIVSVYAAAHSFIQFVRAPSPPARSFSSKIRAFQYGYARILTSDYEFIGNLDADTRFNSDYYKRLIEEMQKNRHLGAGSGVAYEPVNGVFKRNLSSLNHVIGPSQFYRRQCFEAVGGYRPVTVEGEDAIVERTARMLGWETRSFPELSVYHLRSRGVATGGSFRHSFRIGLTEYHTGNHPLWTLARAFRYIPERPAIVGSLLIMLAYIKLWVTKAQRDAPDALTSYVQREQMLVIRKVLRRLISPRWGAK